MLSEFLINSQRWTLKYGKKSFKNQLLQKKSQIFVYVTYYYADSPFKL